MQIKFYGHACFSIKEGDFTVVTDPYGEGCGLKLPGLKANVVTVSYKDAYHSNTGAIEGEPRVFSWPGEYETSRYPFKGIASFHNQKEDEEQKENTIFTVDIKGIRLCHLGVLGTKLTPEQLEQIGDVDILFVPVGGKQAIDAKKAKEVVEQIEPRVIIPMIYDTEGSNCGLGAAEPFLSEMGSQGGEPIDAFDVKRSELPDEMSKVVVISQTQ